MSIAPSGGRSLGRVSGKKTHGFDEALSTDARAKRRVEREVLIDMAGDAANSIAHGDSYDESGSTHDFNSAANLLGAVCSSDEEAGKRLSSLWYKARDLLQEPNHWHMVEALARALLKEKTIPAARARKIMRDAQPQPPKLDTEA